MSISERDSCSEEEVMLKKKGKDSGQNQKMKKRKLDMNEEEQEITLKRFLTAMRRSMLLRKMNTLIPIQAYMDNLASLDVDLSENCRNVVVDLLLEMEEDPTSTQVSGQNLKNVIENLKPQSLAPLLNLSWEDQMSIIGFLECLSKQAEDAYLASSHITKVTVSDPMAPTFTGGMTASGIGQSVNILDAVFGQGTASNIAQTQRILPHMCIPYCSMSKKVGDSVTSLKLTTATGPHLIQFKLFNTMELVGIPFTERYHKSLMNGQISCDQTHPLWPKIQDLIISLEQYLKKNGAAESTFQGK